MPLRFIACIEQIWFPRFAGRDYNCLRTFKRSSSWILILSYWPVCNSLSLSFFTSSFRASRSGYPRTWRPSARCGCAPATTGISNSCNSGREFLRSLSPWASCPGIVLSYQFGTNWSRFSLVVGNIVGPLIGYEVLSAFFLEATFLGVLLFGFNRVPPWLYVLSAAIVAVGTAISAFWILSANSWMQTPTGHQMIGGIAHPGRLAGHRLQSEFSVPLRAYAQCSVPHDRFRRARGWRTLYRCRPPPRRGADDAQDGNRTYRNPGSAAVVPRRSART